MYILVGYIGKSSSMSHRFSSPQILAKMPGLTQQAELGSWDHFSARYQWHNQQCIKKVSTKKVGTNIKTNMSKGIYKEGWFSSSHLEMLVNAGYFLKKNINIGTLLVIVWTLILMWVKQFHKPSSSHHHFYRW